MFITYLYIVNLGKDYHISKGGNKVNFLVVNSQFDKLKELLLDENTDVSWSNYENVNAVFKDLDFLQKGITRKDIDSCKEMLLLLAPTSSLQEISISSGWGNEFLEIATSLERELKDYAKRA